MTIRIREIDQKRINQAADVLEAQGYDAFLALLNRNIDAHSNKK